VSGFLQRRHFVYYREGHSEFQMALVFETTSDHEIVMAGAGRLKRNFAGAADIAPKQSAGLRTTVKTEYGQLAYCFIINHSANRVVGKVIQKRSLNEIFL